MSADVTPCASHEKLGSFSLEASTFSSSGLRRRYERREAARVAEGVVCAVGGSAGKSADAAK